MAFNTFSSIAPFKSMGFGGGMSPFGSLGSSPFGASPFGGESASLSPEAGEMNPYMNFGGQNGQSPMDEMAELAMILGLLLGLMSQMQGGNGCGSPCSPLAGGGGYPGAIPGVGGGFPGGSGGFGGSSEAPSGAGSNGHGSASGPIQATGTGAQAVKLAQSQMGKAAVNVNLPDYSHAGGVTNDCADFVSACVADAGTFKKSSGDVNVRQFQSDLQSQGWKAVSRSQTQPGDVAIILGGGVEHTELVAAPGATTNIGSNGTSTESVSTDNLNWATGVTYYAPPT